MKTTNELMNGAARGPSRSRPGRPGRRAVARVAALAIAVGGSSLAAVPTAVSQTGDGTVTVKVIRAVDNTGTYTPALEPGMAGVKVTLTDDAGVSIDGTTAADGTVTLSPATGKTSGGKYRVQVVNPKPGVLFPAFASRQGLDGAPNQLSSNEEFVDLGGGKNVSYTTGLWNPADYCQKNAPLATACQTPTYQGGNQRTLVTFPYDKRGQEGPGNAATNIATDAETGTIFGLAWNKADKRLFSAATAKRTTDYGPGGSGGIYVTDLSDPAKRKTTVFTTVPDAGSTAHGPGTDDAFLDVPGKQSLGGIKVTDDGKDLFVVNLNDRKLYRYDATQPTASAPKASYPIPDPGCPSTADWRPYGLGMQDGSGFLGGVCSGESTGKLTDVRAVVMPFDLGTGAFGKPVLDQPLDYPRQSTVGTGTCDGAGWFPWTSTFPGSQNGKPCNIATIAFPEPELGEILFETDGSMLLAFKDRFADRGPGAPAPNSATVMSGGDLNKACPSNGMYVMDVNLGCGKTVRGARFFSTGWDEVGHHNTVFAGIALSKVESTVAGSAFDPDHTPVGYGTSFMERANGAHDPKFGLRLTPAGTSSPFGKGAAMGDLEVLCDQAPLQIGNRVWYDPEREGIQNPGQPGEGRHRQPLRRVGQGGRHHQDHGARRVLLRRQQRHRRPQAAHQVHHPHRQPRRLRQGRPAVPLGAHGPGRRRQPLHRLQGHRPGRRQVPRTGADHRRTGRERPHLRLRLPPAGGRAEAGQARPGRQAAGRCQVPAVARDQRRRAGERRRPRRSRWRRRAAGSRGPGGGAPPG